MRVGIIRCLVFATIFLLTLAVIAQAQKAEQRIPYYATAEAGWQWPANSDGITYIPVCWENPQGYTTEEGWVRTRILNTWQAAANVSFYYWGACIPTYKG